MAPLRPMCKPPWIRVTHYPKMPKTLWGAVASGVNRSPCVITGPIQCGQLGRFCSMNLSRVLFARGHPPASIQGSLRPQTLIEVPCSPG